MSLLKAQVPLPPVQRAVDYCSVVLNKNFDPVACVATHLPWWVTPLVWIVAILLALTAVQNTLWLWKLLFEPAFILIKNVLVDVYDWVKSHAGS